MEYLYIEFLKKDTEKLNQLIKIVNTMKKDISSGQINVDVKWLELFSDEDIDEFWWPNQEQYEEIKKLFGDNTVKISNKKDNPRVDWDIYSMFDAIGGGEYELIGIKEIEGDIFRLEFNPYSYPYGGIDALKKLISALGHTIISFDRGFGRKLLLDNNIKPTSEVSCEEPTDTKKMKWWKLW